MRKYCKALVNLGVAFIILTLIVFLVPKLLVFFAPFVAGWIIALIASPLVRFFEEKVKIKRKAGSAFVIVAVIALVILILYLVGAKLVDEIMGLIGAPFSGGCTAKHHGCHQSDRKLCGRSSG